MDTPKFFRKDEVLTRSKVFYPKPDGQDQAQYNAVMDLILDKVINDVCNYTHIPITELPPELDLVLIGMMGTIINERALLAPIGTNGKAMASVSEGDTSITFRDQSAVISTLASVDTVNNNYRAQLNSFRQVIM
ncbi:hypothetical protein FMM01_02110 [Schleiferilactobacillus harbinensis]|uniref:hypothetical protein n=1 Tax=Schleiferilactobacillus harbinensis TaxID=304207 RepID=UPI001239BA0A|nr:hypothetical protein [Schleiferilactobacillus harbinensis]QEU46207.1 hypothetical protein FMM01_02110 [Schleiferilactobacillus harbinensis]